jgi:glycosyltransferase involved in cell wall biosynthesis
LEVQAAGVPIVASSIAGIKEAVMPAYLNWLAKPKDTQRFSDLLLQLLEQPEKRKSFVSQAKSFVEQNFSMTAAVDRFQNLYKTLYDSHSQKQLCLSHN